MNDFGLFYDRGDKAPLAGARRAREHAWRHAGPGASMVHVNVRADATAEKRIDVHAPSSTGHVYEAVAPVAEYVAGLQTAVPAIEDESAGA